MEYTAEEIWFAKKFAYNYLNSYDFLIFNRDIKVDRRTRIGNLAETIFFNEKDKVNKKERIELKRERQTLKSVSSFKNIFDYPLVKDYINNKNKVQYITNDKIQFIMRNHWAKNEKDRKILKILKKAV